jgi:Domain of unknown function (DUF4331)
MGARCPMGVRVDRPTVVAVCALQHMRALSPSAQTSLDAWPNLQLFRSYEAGRQDFVTILANCQPFQDPQGGPNFYMFNPAALYEIHIDNNGDAVEDLTFQFRFKNTSKASALTVGGKAVKIPLINSGTLSGVNPAALNVRETFTIDVVRGNRRGGSKTGVTNAAGGATEFDKPVDNIGDKTFGSASAYAAYANQHIYNVMIPGCSTPARVFVGQRKEPFYIAVGKAFDLFNLNPLGAEVGGNNNDQEAKNVSTLAMEVPIACDDDKPSAASLEVPDSAGASSAALKSYLQGLGPGDERGEPLRIKDSLTLPLDDEAEPIPLT